jgi:3-dehydroquinate dehydratase-1
MNFDDFVLAASTADLADEPAARENADAVEYRIDLSEAGVDALRGYDGALPIIATNRVEWEGGAAPDDSQRVADLVTAVEQPGVEAVDVELDAVETCQPVIEQARAEGVSVIVSVHDFEATPPAETLTELLERACAHGDVGKLAVTAGSVDDVLALLSATRRLTADDQTVATMAMGEPGRHSRAVAPLYGSRIGYAPVDPADATAPGQYDLRTLRELVGQLRSERS